MNGVSLIKEQVPTISLIKRPSNVDTDVQEMSDVTLYRHMESAWDSVDSIRHEIATLEMQLQACEQFATQVDAELEYRNRQQAEADGFPNGYPPSYYADSREVFCFPEYGD